MDEQAFALLIEPHRRALHLHCYRMLGSLHDAEDALQETMLRAWKGSDHYEPRAQLATWLHTIATNVCLTTVARRRARPAQLIEDLEHLQPYPDRLLEDLVLRETVELAFITAIQLLPPKQRAVLVLRDVLGWSAKETAEALEDSVAAVNSTLQRARIGVERTRRPTAPGRRERALVKRFMAAWDAVDIDGLVALLTDDALMTMPPERMLVAGARAIGDFFGSVPQEGRLDEIRLVPTSANRQPRARRLLARRRRQAPAVRPDGVANRERPDRRHRRLPGSLAVRAMRPALRADVGAVDIDPSLHGSARDRADLASLESPRRGRRHPPLRSFSGYVSIWVRPVRSWVRGGKCPPVTRRTTMTQYLLSVHSVEGEGRDPMTEEEMQQFMQRVGVLEEEMKSAGAWLFGGALHESDTATVVRMSGSEVLTTDGPFAESKEHLGGFYIIEAEDLDAALAWASKTTAAVSKPIEVRPFRHVSEA